MARVVLIGLPGTGKSAVARALGAHYGVEWVDTDDEVAAHEGASPGDLIRTRGEGAFRDLESRALESALARDVVVATGGGVVERVSNRDALRAAPTVWLDAPDEILLARVGEGDRPLLGDDPVRALAELRQRRRGWYEEVARVRVAATGTLDEVVAAVVDGMMSS